MKILGLGNAVIDVTANIENSFLEDNNIEKGLCYESHIDQATHYLNKLKAVGCEASYTPGGSAANTMICIAALGGTAAFSGFIGKDDHGKIFTDSIALYDVSTEHMIIREDQQTGKIFVLVTPDCQRSFMSFHGAAGTACHEPDHHGMIEASDALYIEGFSLYSPNGYDMFRQAAQITKAQDKLVIFNPCDANVVIEKSEAVADLMSRADIVIANRHEALAMTKANNLKAALNILKELNKKCIVITDSENGAYILENEQISHCPVPRAPEKIINDNGAGDNFAGGFLYGYLHQKLPAIEAAKIGHICACYILAQLGTRPAEKDDLKKLLASL